MIYQESTFLSQWVEPGLGRTFATCMSNGTGRDAPQNNWNVFGGSSHSHVDSCGPKAYELHSLPPMARILFVCSSNTRRSMSLDPHPPAGTALASFLHALHRLKGFNKLQQSPLVHIFWSLHKVMKLIKSDDHIPAAIFP